MSPSSGKSENLKFAHYAAQHAAGRSSGGNDPDAISPGRKRLFYGGIAAVVAGFFLFLAPFFTAVSEMKRIPSPFDGIPAFRQSMRQSASRETRSFAISLFGFVLFFAGGVLMSIGRHGAAGSGLVLDPKRAREELKPFSRQAGGMVKDAMDAAGIHPESFARGKSETTVVKIRCRGCGALSEETSRFCGQCGKPL